MNYKREIIDGYYNENDAEYPYTLEIIIRDESGRNDTSEIVWEDNGNIMADAVRDNALSVLAEVTGKTIKEIDNMVDKKVIDSQ